MPKHAFTLSVAVMGTAGFVLSAITHGSTYFGFDPIAAIPGLFVLHLGCFLAAFARRYEHPAFAERYGPETGTWVKGLVCVLAVYAMVSFAIFMCVASEGTPRALDGGYALYDHSKLVREISEAEFHRRQSQFARGFSGHWMLFYCVHVPPFCSAARSLWRRWTRKDRVVLPRACVRTTDGRSL